MQAALAIEVDLEHLEVFVFRIGFQFLEHGLLRAAGRTPRREDVDEDRRARGLRLLEGFVRKSHLLRRQSGWESEEQGGRDEQKAA